MCRTLKCYSLFLLIMFLSVFCQMAQGQLALTSENGFVACGEGSAFELTVKRDTTGKYTNYRIEWGDGSTFIAGADFTEVDHTYLAEGAYTLSFYGEIDGVWSGPVTYQVSAENKEIGFKVEGSSKGAVCKGQQMVLKLTDMGSNGSSTEYTIDYGDGTPKEVKEGQMDNLTLTHPYNKSSCDAGGAGFYVNVSAINGCKTLYDPSFGPYPIVEQLKLELNLPVKECTGFKIDLKGATVTTPATCGSLEIKKTWTKNGVKVDNPNQVFDTPGTYVFVASATMNGLDCGNDPITKTIEIIEKVEAIVTPPKVEVCEGGEIVLDASGSKGGEKKYTWSVESGDVSNVQFLPGENAATVRAVFSRWGDYKIRVYVNNDCSNDEAFVEVHVKKEPEVIKKAEIQSICPEGTGNSGILRFTIDQLEYHWYNNPKKPTWRVSGPEGGWAWANGSTEHTDYPQIKFTKPGSYTLTVKADGVGCGALDGQLQQS